MKAKVSFVVLLILISCVENRPLLLDNDDSNLILISFDGFRWDYMENHTLPSLNKYFVGFMLNINIFLYFTKRVNFHTIYCDRYAPFIGTVIRFLLTEVSTSFMCALVFLLATVSYGFSLNTRPYLTYSI